MPLAQSAGNEKYTARPTYSQFARIARSQVKARFIKEILAETGNLLLVITVLRKTFIAPDIRKDNRTLVVRV